MGLVRTQRRAQRIAYALDAEAWERYTEPIREVCAMVERVAEEAAATNSSENTATTAGS